MSSARTAVGSFGELVVSAVGDTLQVVLNRPERLNAITPRMLDELAEVWSLAEDPAYRTVVISGAGRGFCAGADLAAWQSARSEQSGADPRFGDCIERLYRLSKPVIAAVNGPAAGAGLSLALAADIRVGAETATLTPAHVRVGLAPDAGLSFLVPELIGQARAFEWLASGRVVYAEEARDWGVFGTIVHAEQTMTTALALAAEHAARPAAALRAVKSLLRERKSHELRAQIDHEQQLYSVVRGDPESRAALDAARAARPLPPTTERGTP